MWKKDGRIPDLVGPKNGNALINRVHPEFAPNSVYYEEENKIHLVDISASTKYFSRDASLPLRIELEIIVRNMRKIVEEVQPNSGDKEK